MRSSLSPTRYVLPQSWEAVTHVCRIDLQSSSFVGPLVVGLIADATGNIRYAFFFLVFMIWSAVPILMAVNVERGREDAQRYTALGT